MTERAAEDWPTDEEIRDRVGRVMAGWGPGSDFAEVLSTVFQVCPFLDNVRFAQLYREQTGRPLDPAEFGKYRKGNVLPPYRFVADLADHALLLPIDPEPFRPAGDGRAPGERRVQLFASAGLIEVTPESTRQWNREVLARYGQLRAAPPPRTVPTWHQLMHKLSSFHLQGRRTTVASLAEEARAATGDPSLFPAKRLANLLNDSETAPTEKERAALYRVLGLDDYQVRSLEEGIEVGDVPLKEQYRSTPFSRHLGEVLDRLRMAGISTNCLARMTADPLSGQPGISHSAFSEWRRGATSPTLACLRDATRGLARCVGGDGRRLVPPEEVDALLREAGFEPAALTLTCHQVIAGVTTETRIQPLLSAIRNAADVSVPVSAVVAMDHEPQARPVRLPAGQSMAEWETRPGKFPTPEQLREMLTRYNFVLTEKGHPCLSSDEMERVVAVAERDRRKWFEQPLQERIGRRYANRSTRPGLDPGFEVVGPGGR
jgi:hypothetical protein